MKVKYRKKKVYEEFPPGIRAKLKSYEHIGSREIVLEFEEDLTPGEITAIDAILSNRGFTRT